MFYHHIHNHYCYDRADASVVLALVLFLIVLVLLQVLLLYLHCASTTVNTTDSLLSSRTSLVLALMCQSTDIYSCDSMTALFRTSCDRSNVIADRFFACAAVAVALVANCRLTQRHA
jgi:hypothetical protein